MLKERKQLDINEDLYFFHSFLFQLVGFRVSVVEFVDASQIERSPIVL